MTAEDMAGLQPGDLIRHKHSAEAYTVQIVREGRVLALRAVEMTNAAEWNKVDRGGNVIA